jgi:hypothetical protein
MFCNSFRQGFSDLDTLSHDEICEYIYVKLLECVNDGRRKIEYMRHVNVYNPTATSLIQKTTCKMKLNEIMKENGDIFSHVKKHPLSIFQEVAQFSENDLRL